MLCIIVGKGHSWGLLAWKGHSRLVAFNLSLQKVSTDISPKL